MHPLYFVEINYIFRETIHDQILKYNKIVIEIK